MSLRVRTWLPIEVTARDSVRSVVSAAVDDWARAWFSRPRLRLETIKPIGPGTRGYGDEGGWRTPGTTTAINCHRRTLSRLSEWALDAGLEPSRASQTRMDTLLLSAFEQKLIDDLARRVDALLDPGTASRTSTTLADDPLAGQGGAVFAIVEDNGGRMFWLAIPFEPLQGLIRKTLPARTRRRNVLTARRAALGPQTITFEAALGEAELSLDDLRTLAPGDVLILNKRLNEPADIRLQGASDPAARAKLVQIEGQVVLTLQP